MTAPVEGSGGVASEAKFRRLYSAHASFVRRRLAAARIPPRLRDDVAQEVWLTVHRRIDDVREEEGPRGWIAQVIRNHLQHSARSFARRVRREDAFATVERSPAAPHPRADARFDVERLLKELSREQRQVVVECELMGRSVPELAASSGVPRNTIYSRLRLARSRLARLASALVLVVISGVELLRRGLRRLLSARVSAGGGSTTGGSFADSTMLPALLGATLVGASSHELAGAQPALPRAPRAEAEGPVVALFAQGIASYHRSRDPTPRSSDPSPTPPPGTGAPNEVASVEATEEPVELRRQTSEQPRRRRRRADREERSADNADDAALLRRAQAKLRAGSLRAALRLAEAHGRRFPASDLRITRAALMIDALCGLDRPDAARRIHRRTFAGRDDAALSQRSRERMCW